MQNEFDVIIVAGGLGNRMNAAVPKQFLEINNRPIIVHTISKFLELNPDIFISISAPLEHIDMMKTIIRDYLSDINYHICEGGHTRFHSVKNALQYCQSEYVMVHDAVRPCIETEWLREIMTFTKDKKSAIPYIHMTDSIRRFSNGHYSIMNRDEIIRIQTPQCFHTDTIKKCYEHNYTELFTDDASVWEFAGHELHYIKGLERNIKITTPDDILLASNFL